MKRYISALIIFVMTAGYGCAVFKLPAFSDNTGNISGYGSDRHKGKYSIQDARTPLMLNLLKFLDTKRLKPRPWEINSAWPQRFGLQTS